MSCCKMVNNFKFLMTAAYRISFSIYKFQCNYRPKLRRLCFYTSLSFCSRGTGSTWAGTPPDQVHPRDQVHPPARCIPSGPGTPHTKYTPGTRYIPQDQVHPPGPGTFPRQTATVADGTHPTGMHSCFLVRKDKIEKIK